MSDKKITVRILESRSGDRFDYRRGQIVDLPEEQAKKWIARGIAAQTDEKAPTPANLAERAISQQAKKAEKR